MNDILSDPILIGGIMAVVGWAVERFAPQFIPFFAVGKKIAAELIELHNKSEAPNKDIAAMAEKEGLKRAHKLLAKTFDV